MRKGCITCRSFLIKFGAPVKSIVCQTYRKLSNSTCTSYNFKFRSNRTCTYSFHIKIDSKKQILTSVYSPSLSLRLARNVFRNLRLPAKRFLRTYFIYFLATGTTHACYFHSRFFLTFLNCYRHIFFIFSFTLKSTAYFKYFIYYRRQRYGSFIVKYCIYSVLFC